MAGIIKEEREVADLLGRTDHEAFRQQAPAHYTPARDDHGSALQRDIKSIILQNSHTQLPEEALQLVNEIERRALAEIEKLRA